MVSSSLIKPLADTVPEFYHYEDTGCEVSSSCLNCPLPRCKYDDPIWYQRYRRLARDLKVLTTMRLEGLTVEGAAERFSVTVRTIFRIMRRCREAMDELSSEELYAFAMDYLPNGPRTPHSSLLLGLVLGADRQAIDGDESGGGGVVELVPTVVGGQLVLIEGMGRVATHHGAGALV